MDRRRLIAVGVVVVTAGLFLWVASQVLRSGQDPATPVAEVAGTTATTVVVFPTTSTVITTGASTTAPTVTSTTDRSADQEQPEEQVISPTTVEEPPNTSGGETPTGDDQVDTPDSSDSSQTVPVYRPKPPVPLDWDGGPIEFRILAVNSLDDGFVVVDLSAGLMRVYLYGNYPFLGGALDVAAFTRRGDVLIYPSGESPIYVVPDLDLSAPTSILNPSRHIPWRNSLGKDASGDLSGEKVWLLQRTRADTTLVDLVSIEDNKVVSTVELDGSYWISGLLEDDLYVVGGGEDRDDLVITESGIVTGVSSCEDYSEEYGDLYTLAVFDHHFVCLTLDDDRLLIFYDATTGEVEVITARSGRWSGVFLPEIPAVNTTDRHSGQVLLRFRKPDVTNPPYYATSIYVADLLDHTLRLVYQLERARYILPLGIVDGLLIAKAKVHGESSIVSIELETGDWQTIVGLPPGYFVYDAG